MPIYLQFNDIKGDVTVGGHDTAVESGATGGVWRTTNFLSSDSVAVSRISLSSGGGGVDAQEALTTRKAAELFERASATNNRGKLIVGVDTVELSGPLTGRTRLIFGDDQGVFSKPGMGILKSSDGGRTWPSSGRTSGPGVYKTKDGGQTWVSRKVPVVELVVTDRGSSRGRSFRLKDVTIAPGLRGTVELRYSSVEF